ncbi:MAG: hypothetical protein ACREA9_16575, partial [Pyrinomonadaceae bacterium]
AGRVRAVAGDFPNSTGRYSGQFTRYDIMGRAIQQTNPTEMTNQWAAAGPDDGAGWYSSSQTYDWKGRPLVTTNPDGTTKEASYGGCGCAGGAIVTLTDEGTLVDVDPGPAVNNVAKKRQQKIYSDSLGRTVKTETLNWDGTGPFGTGGSVYSTTVSTYNARDQVTLVRQYQGTEASSVYQDSTMNYDGYGRLGANHAPEQDANTATTYAYNSDDTVQSVTDARGASATYSYNNRHLATGISYNAPAGLTPAPNVSIEFDAAGNRTSMSDGIGSVSYSYDQLSRMTSETRTFNGLGTYPLSYGYNLSGEITSITDPFGAQVGYTRDPVGRVSAVTGAGFGNVSSYAYAFQYRASGQLRQLTYGNGPTLNAAYNPRLQPVSFAAPGISITYQHFDDGRLKYSRDLFDQRFDRSYSYNQAGQLTQALSGAEARGEPANNNRPYKEDLTFDVWGNMTARTGRHWSRALTPFGGVYVNNRMTGWQYDADGRNTVSNSVTSTFDAAGRLIQTSGPQRRNNPPLVLTSGFDGDGHRVKKIEYSETLYFLRSTVLGGAVITEIYGTANQFFGQKQKGHVYANGQKLAEQNPFLGEAINTPIDPSGVEQIGALGAQLDPLGDDVGDEDPYLPDNDPGFSYPHLGDVSDPGSGCIRDGVPWPCTLAFGKTRLGRLVDRLLPRLSRFRPRTNFPNTPPIASNSDTTLGSIFRGATEGTILGDVLNPKLDWRFIVPFIPWGSLYANPQNSANDKLSPECASMRRRLLDDPNTAAAIDEAWRRSQATAEHPKQEHGGLFGRVDGTGSTIDSVFVRQSSAQGSLVGFGKWAQNKIRNNHGIATYDFWYHTHPHEPGEMVPGEGMAINPEFPTGEGGDIGVSQDLKLRGILITKKHVTVFDPKGFINCYFER